MLCLPSAAALHVPRAALTRSVVHGIRPAPQRECACIVPPRWVASQATNTERGSAEMSIEDLDTSYCDDFVCTSSPAVELTVRAVAKDIQRQKYSRPYFQPEVEYSDGLRSFKGLDKYSRPFWPREGVKDPRVVSGPGPPRARRWRRRRPQGHACMQRHAASCPPRACCSEADFKPIGAACLLACCDAAPAACNLGGAPTGRQAVNNAAAGWRCPAAAAHVPARMLNQWLTIYRFDCA